eukprot:6104599-Pyramimonas_sp.AAC.1
MRRGRGQAKTPTVASRGISEIMIAEKRRAYACKRVGQGGAGEIRAERRGMRHGVHRGECG